MKQTQEYSLEELQQYEKTLKRDLPHLFGFGWYDWALEFFESKNKTNLLCAANQISKSSTQIRKCIEWAANHKLWDELWPGMEPNQFWYMYPSQKQVNAEFLTKWSQFLPRGDYKTGKKLYNGVNYGWKPIKSGGDVVGIQFFSGIIVYFKTYTQKDEALQTGTVFSLFLDEECPMEVYDEIMLRISASDGYFHMVFTATIGQEFWRQCLEPTKFEKERLPGAWKAQISMYDCLKYVDGTNSHWTIEKIEQVKQRCKDENEVLRRVYGKFVKSSGRLISQFEVGRHVRSFHPVPKSWHIYSGVDIGSGGAKGHPSAIAFVAVRPDYRAGRVFLGWRGDGTSTTSGDVVEKYIALKKEGKVDVVTAQKYDWHNKDFFTIATRMGEPFVMADKSRDKGYDTLNTLFKNDMLIVYETAELSKLVGELISLQEGETKTIAKDDFVDALRYAVTDIPWDFSMLVGAEGMKLPGPEKQLTEEEQIEHDRRQRFEYTPEKAEIDLEEEISEWNELYG